MKTVSSGSGIWARMKSAMMDADVVDIFLVGYVPLEIHFRMSVEI